MNKVALIQLAAGNSVRFGGDKLLECYQGKPLIAYSAELYARIDFSYRVLVAREKDLFSLQPIACYYDTIVFNPHPEDGISSSIQYGIEALKNSEAFQKGGIEHVLFSVSDQPNLKAKTIECILSERNSFKANIIAPCTKEGKRGNPVLFPVYLLSEFEQLKGDTGGNAVIKKHSELLHTVETDGAELFDIDRKEDMKTV